MRKFDTTVQYLKYKVLREVARHAWKGDLPESISDIPETLVPGKEATMRCCVYKERAILSKRVKLAMGGDKENPNVIEVISIACDECPMSGYDVTEACRGCLAHRCENACKFGAITFDEHQKAHIDKTKCKECGACSKVCPYNAIINFSRPCQNACKVGAISMDEDKAAKIDNEKCISCGSCVYHCPFGAIMDKSYIVDVINMIKESENNEKFHVYAVVAPAVSSQYANAKVGQVVTGIKELGFYKVVEAALGADMITGKEAKELSEKGFLTSSCCPAFVTYIKNNHPNLVEFISGSLSPMAETARYIKSHDEKAKVVFIGPCTAKKGEIKLDTVKPYVDSVLTFEELQALFGSREIEVETLEESEFNDASYFGRIFARCGGLSEAVRQALYEQGITDFNLNAISCAGIDECKVALLRKNKNMLDSNFIEGMACIGGCIGGAGGLSHGPKDRNQVDKYGTESTKKTISDSVSALK